MRRRRNGDAPGRSAGDNRSLRKLLVGVDVTAITLAWSATTVRRLGLPLAGVDALPALVAVLVALALLVHQRLYLSRVCRIKSLETTMLGRVALGSGAAALITSAALQQTWGLPDAAVAAAATFVLLYAGRTGYRCWLTTARRQGRYLRRVAIVGHGDETVQLYRLLDEHPELGFEVCGLVGDWQQLPDGLPWLAPLSGAVPALRLAGANGAVISGGSLRGEELNQLARELLDASLHVHLSAGLQGIDYRRLRPYPLAYEPLFYLEQLSLSRWQVVVKRMLDAGLAAFGLVLALPVLAAAALAVRLEDGGPVLFRQQRVGRDGRVFTLYKLRTMVPDAEKRLGDLLGANQRRGPLFKLAGDPRVTAVGRVLRATSIDELPQLFNVLRGDMSLVGPRPALPSEVEQFDERLRCRTRVLPGITGLWQVEARDDPSFDAYQRLDVYYVENWSVGLDLAILLTTVRVVLVRSIQFLRAAGPGDPSSAPCTLD